MSLTYAQYVADLANMIVVPATDPNYLAVLPNIIDDAEQRIYRELNLLDTVVRDTSATLTGNSRNFTLPSSIGRFVTVTGINVFSPPGVRNQLQPAWQKLIDFLYPNNAAVTSPSIPTRFAMVTDQTIILGPTPDANYGVEVIGTIRPTPLSGSNTTTYLSLYLPDLFLAASMVFAAGYQQNFSAMGDNPQQALSWEAHYKELFASANAEEIRKRYNQDLETRAQP